MQDCSLLYQKLGSYQVHLNYENDCHVAEGNSKSRDEKEMDKKAYRSGLKGVINYKSSFYKLSRI